jgi:hypothetical protein
MKEGRLLVLSQVARADYSVPLKLKQSDTTGVGISVVPGILVWLSV